MPKIHRRETLRRDRELTESQIRHLTHGRPWFMRDDLSRDEFEAAWESYGDELLAEWIEKHPGSRPFAWWLLCHRQERPIVNAFGNPDDWRNREPLKFGFLHTSAWCGVDKFGVKHFQEPERDYLERLGILTDDELGSLAETDAAHFAKVGDAPLPRGCSCPRCRRRREKENK